MINDYWPVWAFGIVTVFGIFYGYSIVEDFRIFLEKGTVND